VLGDPNIRFYAGCPTAGQTVPSDARVPVVEPEEAVGVAAAGLLGVDGRRGRLAR